MEKALEPESRGAVAHADIQQYYDCMQTDLVVNHLLRDGMDEADVAAIACHQLAPVVVLRVGSGEAHLEERSVGALTGFGLACAVGRVVVSEFLRPRSGQGSLRRRHSHRRRVVC